VNPSNKARVSSIKSNDFLISLAKVSQCTISSADIVENC
jgi:hypothetical protein